MSTIAKKIGISSKDIAQLADYDSAVLDKISEVCKKRCILQYKDAILQDSEHNCLDRCVHKYNQTIDIVHSVLAKQNLL